jgi:hypothetical protein
MMTYYYAIRGLPYLVVVEKVNGDAVGEVTDGGRKGVGTREGTLLAEKGRHGTGQRNLIERGVWVGFERVKNE